VALVDSVAPQEAVPHDSTVRALIEVQEGPRHQVRLGFGYATVECFRVQSGWAAHDFLGGARTLDVSARVSKLGSAPTRTTGLNQFCNPFSGTWTIDTLNYTFGITLRQPAFLSRSHIATLGLVVERRSEFGIYTREAIGGNADLTLNARKSLPVTIGYSYSVGRTEASDAVYCVLFRLCDSTSRIFLRDRRQFGAVTLTVARDRVNSVLDPSRAASPPRRWCTPPPRRVTGAVRVQPRGDRDRQVLSHWTPDRIRLAGPWRGHSRARHSAHRAAGRLCAAGPAVLRRWSKLGARLWRNELGPPGSTSLRSGQYPGSTPSRPPRRGHGVAPA